MSEYAVSHGPNLVGGSSGIRVLTAEEALEWCEQYVTNTDIIEQYFIVKDA